MCQTNQKSTRYAFLLLVLSGQVACSGCFTVVGEDISSKQTNESGNARQSERLQASAKRYKLSERAERVAGLMDRKAYAAARGILLNKLPEHPDDAGLNVQYARLLIIEHDPAIFGSIIDATPLYGPGREGYRWGCIKEAMTRAVQLDPEISDYCAAVIMETVIDRCQADLDKGEGMVNSNGTPLDSAHVAMEIDRETASSYRDTVLKMKQQSIELGKVASAMRLGNLYGDMSCEGPLATNRLDFKHASDGFRKSLENFTVPENGDTYWMDQTVSDMRKFFAEELKAVQAGETVAGFDELEAALRQHKYSLLEGDGKLN